jgi:hypothetical protein
MWQAIVETEPASLFDSEARRHLLRLYVEHAEWRAKLQALLDRVPIEKMRDPNTEAGVERMMKARPRDETACQPRDPAAADQPGPLRRCAAAAAATEARNMPGGRTPWEEPDEADAYSS